MAAPRPAQPSDADSSHDDSGPIVPPEAKLSPPPLQGVGVAPRDEPAKNLPETKRCPFCAESIAFQAIKCKHCGSMLVPVQSDSALAGRGGAGRPQQIRTSAPQDPVLMAFLSGCCIAGLGQMILGQTLKGVMIFIGSVVLAVATGGLSILFTWPLGGVDAYLIAKKLKDGKAVGEWECF